MTNNKEALIENIYLKKRIIRWRLIALILVIIAIFSLPSNKASFKQTTKYIARIEIEGEVTENNIRLNKLENIAENPNIQAVILYINSPGGTFVGGESLYNKLNYIASKKPLVAVMGTMATSVGYMIALPAERIFAYRGTITGSIGVFLQSPDISEFTKKLGINFTTIKSGKFKTILSPFETITDEGRRTVEAAINDSYITFIDFIVEKRKLEKDRLLEIADGRIYTGNQALELNLIDQIGDEKAAISWLHESKKISKSTNIKKINLIKDKVFLEKFQISSCFDKFFLSKLQISLAGLFSIWQY